METQALIAHILNRMNGDIHGRVQLQKLLYFCKALGADVNANYRLYIYGPYSQQVADSLQDGVMDEIFQESNGHIQLGINFKEYFDSLFGSDCLNGRQEDIVNDVVATFGNMSVKQLEILATTFFIDRQQKTLFNSTEKQEVLDKVRRAKSSRFTEAEIENSYSLMLEHCVPLVEKYRTN